MRVGNTKKQTTMANEMDFEEWMEWANSINSKGEANVEPIISHILSYANEIGKPIFIGKSWNGSNWANISNAYRTMIIRLLITNPKEFTYAGVLGRSKIEKEYSGCHEIYLCKALGENPNWEEFFSILPNKKEDSSFSNVGCIEKLQLIRDALARIINEHTGSAELAKTFEEFYEANYPIQFPSNYRSELEKSI